MHNNVANIHVVWNSSDAHMLAYEWYQCISEDYKDSSNIRV